MSEETWAALAAVATATIAAVGSIVAAYVARRAERNSRPVANGFTHEVKSSLRRIEQRIDVLGDRLSDHLDAHADRDLRHSYHPPRDGDTT